MVNALHRLMKPLGFIKLSDRNPRPNFVPNFTRMVTHFNLNDAPLDPCDALIRYILLSPAPSEIWQLAPAILFWNDILLPFKECLRFTMAPAPVNCTSSICERILSRYPTVEGRAGGKTNLHLPDLPFHPVVSPLGRITISMIVGGDDNDWEETAAVALILADQFSELMGSMFIPFLHNHKHFLSLPLLQYVKFLKAVHTGVRVTRTFVTSDSGEIHLTRDQSRLLYGIDCITGRSEHLKHDIVDEMRMRLEDPSIRCLPTITKSGLAWSSHAAYRHVVQVCCDEAIDSALSDKVDPISFEDWYAQRMHWAASGGAPGARVVWDVNAPAERMNKRGALLIIPESHIREILKVSCGAVLWSKASLKYENGKIRAIWNTSVEHYVIQAYILDMFEKALAPNTWDTSANNLEAKFTGDIRRLVNLKFNTGVMWDFSDFNINHTQESMADLFGSAVRGISRRLDVTRKDASYIRRVKTDLDACLQWVLAARFNTILEDPESGLIARVVRSMQSGERATSFQNTYLSRVYFLVVHKWAMTHIGRPLLHNESAHLGDDVFATSANVTDGVIACILYNLLGYAGQLFKITVDYSERGEYLRLNYDSSAAKIAGYPVRSAMGLIGGEFFRDSVVDPGDRASAFIDQYSKVVRRSGQIKSQLLTTLIKRNCAVMYTTSGGVKKSVVPNLELLLAPSALGGYGISKPFGDSGKMVGGDAILTRLPATPLLGSICDVALVSVQTIFCLVIPSGEGKTTLKTKYPNLFVDHDDLHQPATWLPLLKAARATNKWDPVTTYNIHCVESARDQIAGKIVLTWGKGQVPSYCCYLGTFILTSPTKIRSNVQNRQSLGVTPATNTFSSWAKRDQAIFRAIGNYLNGNSIAFYQKSYSLTRFTRSGGSVNPPTYEPPEVSHDVFFGARARHYNKNASYLRDFKTMHELGVDVANKQIQRAILVSALPGAFPKNKISDSIANFAEKLDKWLGGVQTLNEPHVVSELPPDTFLLAKDFFFKQFTSLGEILNFPRDYYHGQVHSSPYGFEGLSLSNNFGAFESLILPCGFTSSAALQVALHELEPLHLPGIAGKWCRLVAASRAAAVSRAWLSFQQQLSINQFYYSDAKVLQNLTNYYEGKLSFYPPPYTGYGTTPTSLFRALALNFMEQHTNFLSLDRLSLYDKVSRLELLCADAFTTASFIHFNIPLAYND